LSEMLNFNIELKFESLFPIPSLETGNKAGF